jgi:hypothetical protein
VWAANRLELLKASRCVLVLGLVGGTKHLLHFVAGDFAIPQGKGLLKGQVLIRSTLGKKNLRRYVAAGSLVCPHLTSKSRPTLILVLRTKALATNMSI